MHFEDFSYSSRHLIQLTLDHIGDKDIDVATLEKVMHVKLPSI